VNESVKYGKKYLQSITFYDLCTKILGKDKTEDFKNMFGYDAEFVHCNAYDCLEMFKRDFQNIGTYFVLKNGLSALIDYLLEKLKEHSNIHLIHTTEIRRFKYITSKNITRLYTHDKKSYDTSVIIWAIPKEPLTKIIGWSKEDRDLFQSVESISLHRIFCQFPYKNKNNQNENESWMSQVSRTTTNDGVRQILPLNGEKGFLQLYSDSYWADYWNFKYTRSKKECFQEIVEHLQTLFPEYKNIPEPVYVDSVYWPEGVHMWKPNYNSDIYYDKIQHIHHNHNNNKNTSVTATPTPTSTTMFVIGEAFSKHQCWIEGALETVDDVYNSVIAQFK